MNLRNHIRSVPNFPKPGISFKDISPILADPKVFSHTIDVFVDFWSEEADALVALDARGFIFGGALAIKLNLPLIMLRKAGKLPGACYNEDYDLEYGSARLQMQEGVVRPGMRVLVVDDLLATGGTALAACNLIKRQGGTVAGCAFVIELLGLGGAHKLRDYRCQSLVTYHEES